MKVDFPQDKTQRRKAKSHMAGPKGLVEKSA